MSTSSWLGGTADWSNAAFWSDGVPDGATADASIAASGIYDVTIDLAETFALGGLDLAAAGATLSVAGTLDLAGVITLSAGELDLSGTIFGGTIIDTNGAFMIDGLSATLHHVKFEGVLNVNGSAASPPRFNVQGGLTMFGANGVGPGTINLTGNYGTLEFEGSQTLANATVNLDSGALGIGGQGGDLTVITFAATDTIAVTPGRAGSLNGIGMVVNDGVIDATGGPLAVQVNHGIVNNGTMILSGSVEDTHITNNATVNIVNNCVFAGLDFQPIITNSGTLSIDADSTLTFLQGDSSGLGNLVGTTLTGGTFDLGAGALLQLQQNASITTNDATLVLDGVGSEIESYNTSSKLTSTIEQMLNQVGVSGALELLDGRNFTASAAFLDSGLIELGGADFAAPSLALTATGTLVGVGEVTGSISSAGVIVAAGGQLSLDSGVAGAGAILIEANATLSLAGAVSAGQTASFAGADGDLTLGSPASFAATVTGFQTGDTINLEGVKATSATLNTGDQLVIVNGAVTVATIQLAGDYPNAEFDVAAIAGGSQITMAPISTWTQAVSRDWGVAGNWSDGVPDTAGFVALIPNGFPVISSNETFSIGSGSIGSSSNNAKLTVLGTLSVANTLSVTSTGTLDLEGKLKGGTLAVSGSFESFLGGTLDGVTFAGSLDITNQNFLRVRDGLIITNADGSGPGTINIDNGKLTFVGDQSLDNCVVNLESSATPRTIAIVGTGNSELGLAVLTLGGQASIVAGAGKLAYVDGALTDDGLVQADRGSLYLKGGQTIDVGSLQALDGGVLYASGGLGNLSGGVLTGGAYLVDGSSGGLGGTPARTLFRINVKGTDSVTGVVTDDANITLIANTAILTTFVEGANGPQVRLESTLTTIGSDGALHLLDGRNFGTGAALFTNGGTLQLGGGRFSAKTIDNLSGGTITGFGDVFGFVDNAGLIEASGGALTVVNAVTGAGSLAIDAGASLTLSKSVAVEQTVTFAAGGAELTLGLAQSFKGAISGFGSGDTIDLQSIAFGAGTKSAYSGTSASGTLTVTDGSVTARIALIGQYSATSFQAASDGHGGTDVTFLAAPAGAVALAAPGA